MRLLVQLKSPVLSDSSRYNGYERRPPELVKESAEKSAQEVEVIRDRLESILPKSLSIQPLSTLGLLVIAGNESNNAQLVQELIREACGESLRSIVEDEAGLEFIAPPTQSDRNATPGT